MLPTLNIRRARPEDASELTRIAVAAKGHWGYPTHWLEQWREALTVTPAAIRTHPTFAAVTGDGILGFYSLVFTEHTACLEHLWVTPDAIGRGIGRTLFEHAEAFARKHAAHSIHIVSDPHAEEFYCRMGATTCRHEFAPMDDRERLLPVMTKTL